jgi:hypothetical protein
MEQETARIVEIGITVLGSCLWLCGLIFVAETALRKPRGGTGGPAARLISGHVPMERIPPQFIDQVTAALAQSNLGIQSTIRILEKTRTRVEFEGTRGVGFALGRGRIELGSEGSLPSGISYSFDVAGGRWMLKLAGIFLALGLAAIVIGYLVVTTHAVPSPLPAVRWQTLQGIQIIHFLWPPFLFAGLYRRIQRVLKDQFETLIHNLPYTQG